MVGSVRLVAFSLSGWFVTSQNGYVSANVVYTHFGSKHKKNFGCGEGHFGDATLEVTLLDWSLPLIVVICMVRKVQTVLYSTLFEVLRDGTKRKRRPRKERETWMLLVVVVVIFEQHHYQ